MISKKEISVMEMENIIISSKILYYEKCINEIIKKIHNYNNIILRNKENISKLKKKPDVCRRLLF